MTTEMGPRDVDLGVTERVAGHCVRVWAWLVSLDDDGPRVQFDPSTATFRVSGESEYAGDEFARARAASTLVFINIVLAFGLIALFGAAPVPDNAVGWAVAGVGVPLMLASMVVVKGSVQLIGDIDVIDHTTEPAPAALDDLEAAYMDGEIDEQELGEKAAEVWEDA